ncbi:MAG: glycosyltransferase family 2 protein [Bacteroidales bacterium]|nr:glycosyltransferase family 2 protein [Bacteroidales bacterium]
MINYSFIIPHYNIPDLLGRCIRSIPSREDIQIIVVDDNSPGQEMYLSTIPELRRKEVEYYASKEGKGAGYARNIGLSYAVGKWLIFADADDFFVENVMQILDTYREDTSDIIYFNIKSCECYNTDIIIPSKKDRLFKKYSICGDERIFRIGSTEPWGKMIKRELISTNRIVFQETRAHNDLLFSVMSGTLAHSIKIIDKPFYWYVYREGSLGHQKGAEPIDKLRDRIIAWKSTQAFLDTAGIKTSMYLPAIPCIRVLKKYPALYSQLFGILRETNCNRGRVFFELLRYPFRRYLCKKGLGVDEQLVY